MMSQHEPPEMNPRQPVPPSTGVSPPAGPPAGGFEGDPPMGSPASAPPEATVVIRPWVTGDWFLALRVGGIGLALLLLLGVVVTGISVVQRIAGFGLDAVDWAAVSIAPLSVVLGWAGGGSGAALSVTPIVYLFVAFLVVARGTSRASIDAALSDPSRAVAAGGKIGAVAAGLLLVVGVLVTVFASGLLGRSGMRGTISDLDLTTMVFFVLFVGTVAGLLALVVAGQARLVRVLGFNLSMPRLVRAGVAGGRHVLLIGAGGLLALSTLGSLLDALTAGVGGFRGVVVVFLGTVAGLLVGWLDTALLLMLGTSKFLHDGGFVWARFGGVAGWMWLSIPVLLLAYAAGGVAAAKAGRPRSQAEATKFALLVGPVVALVSLVVAAGWAGQAFIDDIVPIAIFLPLLWGLVAMAGAWLWANQQGLPSGLVIASASHHSPSTASGGHPVAQPGGMPTGSSQDPATWAPPTSPAQDVVQDELSQVPRPSHPPQQATQSSHLGQQPVTPSQEATRSPDVDTGAWAPPVSDQQDRAPDATIPVFPRQPDPAAGDQREDDDGDDGVESDPAVIRRVPLLRPDEPPGDADSHLDMLPPPDPRQRQADED